MKIYKNTTLSEQFQNTTLSEQFQNTTLSNSSKIPHCRNSSKMPHCRNSSKMPHYRNSSKIPHCRNSSKIPHCRNSSKIPHCWNSESGAKHNKKNQIKNNYTCFSSVIFKLSISLEMPVPSFPSFPVVDWFCLFVDSWVLSFSLEDYSVFGNFVITLICSTCTHTGDKKINYVCVLTQY
jgi:hypothetical protein